MSIEIILFKTLRIKIKLSHIQTTIVVQVTFMVPPAIPKTTNLGMR